MSSVSMAVIKRLYALSSNRCAFPRYSVPLVDSGGKVTGRICHIKAKNPGGPRWDAQQIDEQRDSFENLLLLCPIHHDVVDADVESYSVDRLTRIKAAHEVHAQPIQPLADNIAAEFINLGNVAIVGGSAISSSAQSGGQIANVIANYLGSEPIGRGGWSTKLREKEADVLNEAWDKFHDAYGAAWDATSPMQQVAKVESFSVKQLEEFLATLDIPESQKDR